jgi:hypothetical protein
MIDPSSFGVIADMRDVPDTTPPVATGGHYGNSRILRATPARHDRQR